MASEPRSLDRNSRIDLLRGISIVLVVLHHIALRIPLNDGLLAAIVPRWLLNGLVYNGYEAVFMFFVISGFLITSNALARWGSLGNIHVRSFYVRRVARIAPCLSILLVVLSVLHLAGVGHYVITRADQSWPRATIAALGLHLNWYEGQTGYLPASWDVLWSLSIEELFYLAFPLLCLVLQRKQRVLPVLIAFALSLPLWRELLEGNPIWQEKAYLPGMAAISAGVVAALLSRTLQQVLKGWLTFMCAAGSMGILAVLLAEDLLWKVFGNGTLLMLTLSSACLVLAFAWQRTPGKCSAIPGTAWLCSGGRLSYEIYLTHMFVVWMIVDFYRTLGGGPYWGFLCYVPALGLAWLLGWLVSRYVSVPLQRALNQLHGASKGQLQTLPQ